jgi:hypothetical protein
MRHFLHYLPYPNKNPKVAHVPDELLVGEAARVLAEEEQVIAQF